MQQIAEPVPKDIAASFGQSIPGGCSKKDDNNTPIASSKPTNIRPMLRFGDGMLIQLMNATMRARGGTLATISFYVWGFVRKVILFTYTVNGGFCESSATKARNVICSTCNKLQNEEPYFFCGACGCWKWALAHLPIKNRFRNHRCPSGKFPPLVNISMKEKALWQQDTTPGKLQRLRKCLLPLLVVLCLLKLLQFLSVESSLLPILMPILLSLPLLLRSLARGMIQHIPMQLE